jgi:chorismate dehydratase
MHPQPVRISAVSYLNSKPFLYGLENTTFHHQISISLDSPALCAEKLLNHEADIGLVPVAIMPFLKNPQIVVPYCIGADGKVGTVCLFSEVPMEEIKTIYLDYQSRTSVELVRILCKEYWNADVRFAKAFPGYESEIKGTTAGVIIGDRAIHLSSDYNYVYDLAEAWKLMTGLPFVFAAWVSCKEMDPDFLMEFNKALQFGLDNRDKLLEKYAYLNNERFDVKNYLYQNIQYDLTEDKQQGLELFLKKLQPKETVVYCF